MSAVLGLFRLQQVDSRIGQLETRLQKIQDTLENDVELKAAVDRLQAAQQDERRIEHERRAAEEAAREQQIKIQQTEGSLYGGSVHNPKELQDLQADVTSLKKRLAATEEQELEAMVRLESAQAACQAAEAGLTQIRARLGTDNGKLLDEQAVLARELEVFRSERQAAVSPIDARWLRSYEAIRKDHRGLAVAEVRDDSCGACGGRLTAALQQNARHATELVLCPSCGRILFAG